MIDKAISACLCGVTCRYDGTSNMNLDSSNALLICPEVAGGLGTPRNPVEIVGEIKTNAYDDLVNKIIFVKDKEGNDYSQEFITGAQNCLAQIQKNNIKSVILKSNSPSCGLNMIYDGTFSKKKIIGSGVFASLLIKNGIKVIDK